MLTLKPPWSESRRGRKKQVDAFGEVISAFIDRAQQLQFGARAWISTEEQTARAYAIYTKHARLRTRLEISNLTIKPKGRGTLTTILDYVEKRGKLEYFDVGIEFVPVAYPRFARFLTLRGYVPIEMRPHCYLLRTFGDVPVIDLPNPIARQE